LRWKDVRIRKNERQKQAGEESEEINMQVQDKHADAR